MNKYRLISTSGCRLSFKVGLFLVASSMLASFSKCDENLLNTDKSSRPSYSSSNAAGSSAHPSESTSLRGIRDMVYDVIQFETWSNQSDELFEHFASSYQPWLCSILASLMIGCSGILPLIIIPIETEKSAMAHGVGAKNLRLLLSFAVGSLLGDVFLHLLPEAWHHMGSVGSTSGHSAHLTVGLWILTGIFTFIIVEKMFDKSDDNAATADLSKSKVAIANGVNKTVLLSTNGKCYPVNNGYSGNSRSDQQIGEFVKTQYCNGYTHLAAQNGCKTNLHGESRCVTGYLNLLANGIDNFTHGLAVAGSFLVSFKMGMLTTFAILIHEIPHEIGDFAILLKSGFNRKEAAKAQLATAVAGLGGAIAALMAETTQEIGEKTIWILPFTAGGFLNIALVNVLPDILQENDPGQSLKQLCCLLGGIAVMGLVTMTFD